MGDFIIMRIKERIKVRCIHPGRAQGEAIVSQIPFSFKGEIDPQTGIIPSPSHEHFGKSLKGKILVCPSGKGSSENTNVAYEAMKHRVSPAAIIVREIEPVLAACALIGDIPTVEVSESALNLIETGDFIKVDTQKGYVEIVRKAKEDF